MKITIKRQDSFDSDPYIAVFDFKSTGKKSVAQILDELNNTDDLFDINGKSVRKVRWDCSCLQKNCGSCAMIINGTPALACAVFIDTDKETELKLAPLSKFSCVCDLAIDRSVIYAHAKEAELYYGDSVKVDINEYKHQYLAARCMKCGICLEVCPNYVNDSVFYGPAFANESYLVSTASESRKNKIIKEYRENFESFCSKSLACQSVCPMKIPTLSSIAKMNRKS